MAEEKRTEHPPAAAHAPRPAVTGALVRVTMQEHDGVTIAAIVGEVDISNVDRVAASLTSVSNLALGLVVDLRRVDYLDSAAISLLHDLAMRLRERSQRLIVVSPPDTPPRHVLEITALTARTLVLDELGPAIDAMRGSSDD